jgi:rhodanese-related sulfurtransferase
MPLLADLCTAGAALLLRRPSNQQRMLVQRDLARAGEVRVAGWGSARASRRRRSRSSGRGRAPGGSAPAAGRAQVRMAGSPVPAAHGAWANPARSSAACRKRFRPFTDPERRIPMSLPMIPPERAAELLRRGEAILVDVREADERARAHIPGSMHLPLSRLEEAELAVAEGKPVIFHCASGRRTAENAAALGARAGGCEAMIVEGGLEAWRRAGLPLAENRRAPLPLMRQVQIAAGCLVLLGALLGATVSPAFHALSAFVGAGLVMAGVVGLCPMANLLAAMPWNRRAAA